ncbi:MAG: hypothetical protein E5X48_25100 [Mesorhizobium sp.]|uniref:sacsin N-terminal ATP-binding-like domain-containing protein n=1 Tax=Mesorhizobium sp. TaxID=1871066 RepID=UPI001205609D|nr:hypothetical protein [Mesorhizobium sp.]TIQ33088.1 MAG: hypothetical protein E5X48_25100 [Mesorhizobium sp.]
MDQTKNTIDISSYEKGQEAAAHLLRNWRKRPKIEDPRDSEFARGALDTIIARLTGSDDVDREMREYSEAAAEQLTSANRTIYEILQNADDQKASSVRFAFRRHGRGELLIAHNGDPVVLPDVIAMTLAFLSWKRADAAAKGRFGIGLKTLNQLGARLGVHCPPYHFMIEKGRIKQIEPVRQIRYLFDASLGDTLLALTLDQEFSAEDIDGWVKDINASHLLFLDHVRTVSLTNLTTGRSDWVSDLFEEPLPSVQLELRSGMRIEARRSAISDRNNSKRIWSKYQVDYPVPSDLKRAHKATAEITPLTIAVSELCEPGIIAAGMALDFRTALPISLSAQFDPDLGRRGLTERKWNKWLFARLGDLAAAVAQYRFEHSIPTAWQSIPLIEENLEGDPWVVECIDALIRCVHERIRVKARINVEDRAFRLNQISYEAPEIAGLLTEADSRRLSPDQEPLPMMARDSAGRYLRVLDDLGDAHRIEVELALELLDLDVETLGPRPTEWFILLTDAAIAADMDSELSELKSVVADDGSRHAPNGAILLVRQLDEDSIAARLKLEKRVAPAYFRATTPRRVREWLSNHCISNKSADPLSILSALSRRISDEPLVVDDETLLMLRGALHAIDDIHQPSLAAAIGNVIAVDGYVYYEGRRVQQPVKPAESYLPTPIAKDTRGWAAASKTVERIQWIDPRYSETLRAGTAGEFGARRFFLLLGAAVGPRLIASGEAAPEPFFDEQPIVQADALRRLASSPPPTCLARDWISPDLNRVIADIVQQPVDGKRRERSRALFETLAREWEQLGEKSETTAMYFYRYWRPAGNVPATWLAHAASEPWLSSKSRKKVAPSEAAIESLTTRLTRGQSKSQYVYELNENDSGHPLVAALGIKGTPPASELLDELRALKEQYGAHVREEDVRPLYAALAALIPRDSGQRMGDPSAGDIRHAFDRENLLLVAGEWIRPGSAFQGKAIFGKRGKFVPDHRLLYPLWHLLRIKHPEFSDCLEVLEEIANSGSDPTREDYAVMVDVFRHLAGHVAILKTGMKRRLAQLPLWTSKGWKKARPLYAVNDRSLENALGEQIALWRPNCSVQSLGQVPSLLGVTLLTDQQFAIDRKCRLEASNWTTSMVFRKTVAHLQGELARKNHRLWEAMDWNGLLGLELIQADPLLTCTVIGGRKVSVARKIHIEDGRLYFADADELGSPDAGARLAASFFSSELPEMLDYAWSYWWRAAEEKGPPEELNLATKITEEDSFHEMIAGARAAVGKRLFAGGAVTKERRIGKIKAPPLPPLRRLKTFEGATIARVEVTEGTRKVEQQKKASKVLVIDPLSPIGQAGRQRPAGPVQEWNEEERERRGYEVLAAAIKEISHQNLQDFRAIRHVGADSIDELRRYFELKAHLGDAPDEVRLEASQFERAVREGTNYFLAVVAGLEEGKKTEISIFPDPVRNLQWHRTSTIKLCGVRSGARRALRILISD